MAKTPHIKEKIRSFVIQYPQAEKFQEDQLSILWFPKEIKLEKDIQDIKTNLSPGEYHGTITTLKLFTHYELAAGADYWAGRFMKMFTRPELTSMASTFATFELAIHKVFYNRINELLHINTDEFYNSYADDPTLSARMEFIEEIVNSKNDLISLGVFSMIEGAILYSAFAYLKHFQARGKNKLVNLVRGIDMSVRDENLHSVAGAWVFRELLSQLNYSEEQKQEVYAAIIEAAKKLFEHEERIVDMIFEKGSIEGITAHQLKNFIQSRLNETLAQLGIPKLYEVTYNPISEWFYKGINDYTFNDFFSGQGKEYTRNWDEHSFVWEEYNRQEQAI